VARSGSRKEMLGSCNMLKNISISWKDWLTILEMSHCPGVEGLTDSSLGNLGYTPGWLETILSQEKFCCQRN
jgi:hypothetical protein